MKKFVNVFAALMLGMAFMAPITAQAVVGKAFLHGVTSPADLADKIDASHAKDPSGKSMLDPARCKRDGSCASPIHYLQALQKVNPGAHLTDVAQVPDFLRTLRVVDAPAGEYWISCLKPSGDGTYQTVLHCLSRSFKPGEKAWVDPKTGIIVFASDCTNVVEKPVPPKLACAEIHFFARKGDTVARNAVGGGTAFQDDCFAIKKVGETEFHAPWKDSCASEHCTFAASEAFLRKKMWMLASYELEEGEYVLRVPASFAQKDSPYVTILCLERTRMAWPKLPQEMEAKAKAALANKPQEPVRGGDDNTYVGEYAAYLIAFKQWRADYASLYDEMKLVVEDYSKQREAWIDGHSDSVNVWWNAYHVGNDGVPRATIYYTEAEVPATESVRMYWRWGVWVREQEARQQVR